ncbi:hypothetical protein H4S07_001574 [Coemansia furcata]|uniref:Uncharacterized protein n=1 Tax=Coemansia furcata TaxID=417177 RepID=A0ACC1LN24_9FUNG|nr:hypothetical protein H4S07_001574 [Coemansia furcata]
MKTSFAAITCLVVAVLAQTNPIPSSDATSPAPEVASTPVTNVAFDQVPSSMTHSLLSCVIEHFDMSHLSSADTATPVMTIKVFNPTMNKFTLLSMNVIQSGDVWYLPVCTIDSITSTGTSAASPAPESCQAIEAAAMEPTRHLSGRPSTGMTYMPEE